jgi:hypothetical protein
MNILNFFKSQILDSLKKIKSEYSVLILDDISTKILSSFCSMTDLLQNNIVLVQNIRLSREPLSYDGIYFISPIEESITLLLNEDIKQYANFHIIFTSSISDECLKILKNSHLVKNKKIGSISEMKLDFYGHESRLFTTQYDNIDNLTDKLVNFCSSLGYNPEIRYQPSSSVAKSLASNLNKKITNGKENIRLLILDRSIDLVSPFMHELTYQAMIHENMDIRDNQYTYHDGDEEKVAILNEDDIILREIRHKFVTDVSVILSRIRNEISIKPTDPNSLKDLTNLVRELPLINLKKSKLTLHVKLANECVKKSDDIIKLVIKDEQLIARHKINAKESLGKIKAILQNMAIPEDCRKRLLLIYLGSNKADVKTIDQLKFLLDIKIELPDFTISSNLILPEISDKKENSDFYGYDPKLKMICKQLCEDMLSNKEFPYINHLIDKKSKTSNGKLPSLRDQPHFTWKTTTKPTDNTVKSDIKHIVYIIGGATYSELRCLYELYDEYEYEIILGSEFIGSAKGFCKNLLDL